MRNANTELDRRDPVATAFAHPAFATLKPLGAPSMLVAPGPFHVAWANAFAADLFGAADCGDLGRRLSRSSGGMVRRLAHLMERLDPGGSPRLERLRFVQSLTSRTITVLCQRVEWFGADGLAVVVLGFEQGVGAESLALWRRSAPGSQEAPPAAHQPSPPGPLRLAALTGTPAIRDALRAALGGQEQGRFVWRTDARGTLLQADTDVFTALAASPVPAVGTLLTDVVRHVDVDAADRLAAALAAPATWSGVEILWPVASGVAALPLVLRASPWFDGGRDFAGFKGFGTFDIATIQPRAEPASAVEALAAPSPPVEMSDPVRPLPDEAAPSFDAAASDAMAAPTAPTESDTGLFAPLANVVRLWPLSTVRALLPVLEAPAEASAPDAGGMAPPDTQPGAPIVEPLPVRAPSGLLTSSEHEAFEEIGRALSAQTAAPAPETALASSGDAECEGPPPEPAAAPPASALAPAPEDDFSRNAAALVEATTAGLMVVRGRMLLFANQALLDLLRYPTHADFDVAVGAALAQSAPGRTEDAPASIVLPTHDGEAARFAVVTRPIQWSGGSARLLTLRPGEASPVETPAALPPSTAPPASAADARALLDATGDAVALIDGHGAVLMLNQVGERWFGRDRSRLAGESFTLLLAVESRAAAAAMLSEVQASKAPAAEARRDVTARSAEGPVLALDMRLARIGQERFSVVWRDLSALRRSERDVAQAVSDAERVSDRQPELLAKLSHQIRTPLNAIIGFAEVMMDERFGSLGNPRYKDYLRDIHASGTQVMSLVNDLLDLSQIEAGRHELDLEAVDINRVIGECVTQIQSEAHRGRVIVRTSFSPRQPMVMADDRATRQIIGNLLSNAVKFNEPGGQVIVSTTTGEGGVALVRIRDTGIGMSDKDIASALEPFRQLAPSRAVEGTGLGLPLTKALVGANGASLSIRSRPGEGTMVEVTFQPAAAPARVPA